MTTWTLILFLNLSLYGYNNIPAQPPHNITGLPSKSACQDAGQRVTNELEPFHDGYYKTMKFVCVEVSNDSSVRLRRR